MKRQIIPLALVTLLAALCVPAVWAQMGDMVPIHGVVHDQSGAPMTGAVLDMVNKDNGRRLNLKTDKKGEFASLGVSSGVYNVKLLKDGKELYTTTIQVRLSGENYFTIDLQKEAAAAQQALPAEVKKQNEEITKENTKIKSLNDRLAAAADQEKAGNYDGAIATLTEATQVDATRDILWVKLADVERNSANKATDLADKNARLQKAIEDYKKGIAIKPVGSYYNNLGEAYAKSGNADEAVNSYTQAAAIDPANAALYYYNQGAVLTNTGKVDEAIVAFDKTIQADPNKADAYYWKGINMIGKATLKDNKMIAPDGTADMFNKYLQLAPTGPYAEAAKQMLATIGSEVESSFGKPKSATKQPAKK